MKGPLALFLIVFMAPLACAAGVGVGVIVPTQNATALSVNFSSANLHPGDTVFFYADYENASGSDVQGATVELIIQGGDHLMEYDVANSAYVFNYTFNYSGTYFFYVHGYRQYYDYQRQNLSLVVYAPDQSGVSQGGGAPTAPAPSEGRITVTIGSQTASYPALEPNGSLAVFMDVLGNSFQQLVITASTEIQSGEIKVSIGNCSHALESNELPYACMTATLNGIRNNHVSGASIYFRVSKNWVSGNDVNSSLIGVRKFSEFAENLAPKLLKEDDNDLFFRADAGSFSDFVVYGIKNNEHCGNGECDNSETCENCAHDCGKCPSTAPRPKGTGFFDFNFETGSIGLGWYMLFTTVLLLTARRMRGDWRERKGLWRPKGL